MKTRSFALPHSDQQLIFTAEALEVFVAFCQHPNATEAGGLLFAEFHFPAIQIVAASPPHRQDGRWRTLFVPNRVLQRRLIKKYFKMGRHFVGEWHTHPEPNPTPSNLDLNSMADAFQKSQHHLNYFLMVIVGNATDTLNLWVSIHDGKACHRLTEI